jgi:hypothetical protein
MMNAATDRQTARRRPRGQYSLNHGRRISSTTSSSPTSKLVLWAMGVLTVAALAANILFFNQQNHDYYAGGAINKTIDQHDTLRRTFIPGVFLPPQKQPLTPEKQPATFNNVEEATTRDEDSSKAKKQQQDEDPHSNAADNGRARVVRMLEEAGVKVTEAMVTKLPTWKQITELYGSHPRLFNEESCAVYRAKVPPERRMIGPAGMFSTGTNLLTTLLKNNCKIPERVQLYGVNATREQHGMRWQVPWGKHTQQQYRDQHATEKAKDIIKNDLLPVVTIRHPYFWMQSMCKNPYTAKWPHQGTTNCPHLVKSGGDGNATTKNWNNVTVKYGAGTENYQSLAHLYNDWYHGYTQHAKYPWLMIRMEGKTFSFW